MNRWIFTQDGVLLNLAHIREVSIEEADGTADYGDSEHKVVAYGNDPIRPENLWVLYESASREDCDDYMLRLGEMVTAARPHLGGSDNG